MGKCHRFLELQTSPSDFLPVKDLNKEFPKGGNPNRGIPNPIWLPSGIPFGESLTKMEDLPVNSKTKSYRICFKT